MSSPGPFINFAVCICFPATYNCHICVSQETSIVTATCLTVGTQLSTCLQHPRKKGILPPGCEFHSLPNIILINAFPGLTNGNHFRRINRRNVYEDSFFCCLRLHAIHSHSSRVFRREHNLNLEYSIPFTIMLFVVLLRSLLIPELNVLLIMMVNQIFPAQIPINLLFCMIAW